MTLAELDLNKVYTYFDYLKWTFEERVELIRGHVFEMTAPYRAHQELSSYISNSLYNFLRGKRCEVYAAPFDVRLTRNGKDDKEIINVFQPDICVVCDLSILDNQGCNGAPDVVVEILSPGNSDKELKKKCEVYEETGVKEYWIVIPQLKSVIVYTLVEGKFVSTKMKIAGDFINSTVLEGFSLDVKELFDEIEN